MAIQTADAIVAEVLRASYARILRKDADGSYAAEVLEFPGCLASGESAGAANEALEEVMAIWVRSELERGRDIPTPFDVREYSGRVTLRIAPSVHERAAMWAAMEGTSLNRLLATAIAAYTGETGSTVERGVGGSGK